MGAAGGNLVNAFTMDRRWGAAGRWEPPQRGQPVGLNMRSPIGEFSDREGLGGANPEIIQKHDVESLVKFDVESWR